jgi:hypothetical protein
MSGHLGLERKASLDDEKEDVGVDDDAQSTRELRAVRG